MQGPPDSQARSPLHMIPFEVLLVLEVEFVWYELEMEIALQTQGQMAKSHLERGTSRAAVVCFHCRADSRHWVSAQQLAQRIPQLSEGRQPSPAWFHRENNLRPKGKLWNWAMNRDLCDIYVVLQQSASGASSSKDAGCLMPATFLIFWKLSDVFSRGNYYFSFLFCFVFQVFFIRGWTNDVLSCESKSAIFASLWSDFFSFKTILLSWNET